MHLKSETYVSHVIYTVWYRIKRETVYIIISQKWSFSTTNNFVYQFWGRENFLFLPLTNKKSKMFGGYGIMNHVISFRAISQIHHLIEKHIKF